MGRTLVIGYGNIERGDDGAAFHVVNRLRADFSQRPLAGDDSGLADLGRDTAVFVPQLVPELALDAAVYSVLVLADAHVTRERRPLVCARLRPEFRPPAFSHHLAPAMFAWLVQAARGGPLAAFVVSLRGHCFDLQRGLSASTAALVGPAADAILRLAALRHSRPADATFNAQDCLPRNDTSAGNAPHEPTVSVRPNSH